MLAVKPPTIMTVEAAHQDAQYPVHLYVYDLSRGMARQMSMALTGLQIDGIWHTSIVAWDREYFFGQGISVVRPGTSHHGAPLETHCLGSTSIDLETFEGALLPDLKEHFRPQDYNLLSHNCNHFSQEVSQILTGSDIPSHIRSLPSDFLSTPFGQMLRPQIDAMFQGPSAAPPAAGNDILSQVAARAYAGNTPVEASSQPASSDAVRHITSQRELKELTHIYPCVAVLFTSDTCPPCKIVKPLFRDLAYSHYFDETKPGNHKRIAFIQIDQSPSSSLIFQQYRVSAVPTVKCFTLGEETHQTQGADSSALRSAVDRLLLEVYPPHPQAHLSPRSLSRIPTRPHVFSSHLNYRTALQKLDSLAAQHPAKTFADKADFQDARRILANDLVPWLETVKQGPPKQSAPRNLSNGLDKALQTLQCHLPIEALFPVMDMLRVAVSNEDFLQHDFSSSSLQQESPKGIQLLLSAVARLINDGHWDPSRKAIYVTTARLLTNATSSSWFADFIESHDTERSLLLELMTALLLCPDTGVRSSAAACAFNVSLHQHNTRSDWTNKDPQAPPMLGSRLGESWETELASALLQAISNESESDETLHRLLAALFYHVHLSQYWEDSIRPLLEVLEAKDVFEKAAQYAHVQRSAKKPDLVLLLDDLSKLLETGAMS